jgi:hypothetical protein
MLECWAFCVGRRRLKDAVQRASEASDLAERIATRARQAFENESAG